MPLSLAEKLFGTSLKQAKMHCKSAEKFEQLDEMPPFSPQEQKILAEFLQSIPGDFRFNRSLLFPQSGSLELSQSFSRRDVEEHLSRISREDAEELMGRLNEMRSNAAQ